ncbi:CobW family GTP-binding protein [Alteribacter aurantiacus]|uniref:CobW family GTP-binding protein n=1 Tax=Alteribacter aurantiacus TaxID=254410 RepID=UPI0004128902|nr:CobW family GTP-binding protein [Alteribacter aurantiacus]
MERIPVYVLSGFLGSGKTTLLVEIIKNAKKKRLNISVLMNEIGKTDTDGKIVSGLDKSMPIEKLLDGCMCCNKKSEVSGAMVKLAKGKPDLIVIELTGVADPEEVADALAEPKLMEMIKLEKVISVLDGEHILDYNSIFTAERTMVRTTRKQMSFADVLLVNKIDQMEDKQREKVEKAVRKHNSIAPITYTSFCNVNIDELLAPNDRAPKEIKRENNKEHPHSRIQTLKLEVPGPVPSKRVVEKFLKELKPGLVRAKGFINIKDNTYLVQHSMKKTYWEKASSEEMYLILIGVDLDVEKVNREWNKWCVVYN